MLPSPSPNRVGALDCVFEAQYPAHQCLCLRFGLCLTTDLRKTRGQDGSLLLSCKTLSFSTSCRFIPALGHPPDRIWRIGIANRHAVTLGVPRNIICKLGRYNRTGRHAVGMFQRSAEFGDTRRTAVSATHANNGSVPLFPDFRPQRGIIGED